MYLRSLIGPLGLTGADQVTLIVIWVSTVALTLVGGDGTTQQRGQGIIKK